MAARDSPDKPPVVDVLLTDPPYCPPMKALLIPCPDPGARAALDAIDESTASQAELVTIAREALLMLRVRPLLLGYIVKLAAWPSKN